jgi:hypothetical protein
VDSFVSVDIEDALLALGIEYDIRGIEANALCPMHRQRTGKEDHSPSWWINLETGAHLCFSCHYKGSILQLVCDVMDFKSKEWGIETYNYEDAKAWLSKLYEVTPEKLKDMFGTIRTRVESLPKPVPMSEARLAVFVEPPTDKVVERHLTAEAITKYEILWDANKQAWILPLRDAQDKSLMGWQEKGTVDRTFKNQPAGLKKSKTLFGISSVTYGDVVLVESPLDCARMCSAGVDNVVAVCGSKISEDQFKLIRFADRIIAAFDNPKVDSAGKLASDEIRKLANKYGANLVFFNYGETGKKDPGDLTNDEIVWGLSHAQSALFGEKAYV